VSCFVRAVRFIYFKINHFPLLPRYSDLSIPLVRPVSVISTVRKKPFHVRRATLLIRKRVSFENRRRWWNAGDSYLRECRPLDSTWRPICLYFPDYRGRGTTRRQIVRLPETPSRAFVKRKLSYFKTSTDRVANYGWQFRNGRPARQVSSGRVVRVSRSNALRCAHRPWRGGKWVT